MGFDPLKFLFEDSRVHWDSNSQSESSFGTVEVHFLTLSYIFGSMKCNSRASLLACTFASTYLGCEPKVRATTIITILHQYWMICNFQLLMSKEGGIGLKLGAPHGI
jgi:hypothetical protein